MSGEVSLIGKFRETSFLPATRRCLDANTRANCVVLGPQAPSSWPCCWLGTWASSTSLLPHPGSSAWTWAPPSARWASSSRAVGRWRCWRMKRGGRASLPPSPSPPLRCWSDTKPWTWPTPTHRTPCTTPRGSSGRCLTRWWSRRAPATLSRWVMVLCFPPDLISSPPCSLSLSSSSSSSCRWSTTMEVQSFWSPPIKPSPWAQSSSAPGCCWRWERWLRGSWVCPSRKPSSLCPQSLMRDRGTTPSGPPTSPVSPSTVSWGC